MKTPSVKFCGAAGTVTGSCYLVTVEGGQFLVDCGLFQGHKTVKELNYGNFPFNPERIDFVLLTHAHIDHSGLIPKLYKSGFKGPVYTTDGTRDLLTIMLPDSGYIHETEVKYVNRRQAQRGLPPVSPIYTREDAVQCLNNIRTVSLCDWLEPGLGIRARFWNAGHILGSASIEIDLPNPEDSASPIKLLFSGDIGPDEKLFHPDPEAPRNVDYLFVESTYGSRDRKDTPLEKRRDILKKEIHIAMRARGNLIIPAFAIERTQELLYDIDTLMQDKDIPNIRVYLDSPLAVQATKIFKKHRDSLDDLENGTHPFSGEHLTLITEVEDSKALNQISSGAIIMAASGMCEAGRIRHHLKNNLWNPLTTILFVGYQAPGTMGHLLVNGAKKVRIHGQEITVRANIRTIDCYSAHADRKELIQWVQARQPVNKGVFLVHGEADARASFQKGLIDAGIHSYLIRTPNLDDIYTLPKEADPERIADGARLPAEKAEAKMDWHNEYAMALLELAEELRSLPTPESRHALLEDIRQIIHRKRKAA